jgi:tripartite-type tricarboxylate transporter receptor subunit TctC
MSIRALAAVIALGLAAAAQAQGPVYKIIVPFPPGGASDITSRILAEHMGPALGGSVIVENRPGGGAVIGYELGARSPADGQTMLNVFPSFVINPQLRKVNFDPVKDFRAIGQTMSLPMAIAVTPSVPANNLQELIALARAKPGSLAYGTPGPGTTQHVVGEMMKLAFQANITHAPFQGSAPALTSLAGGHLPMVIANVAEIAPFVRNGKARAIVVTTAARTDVLPEVPTLREAGYPELEATNWAGLVVPAATPPAAIARLNAALVRALGVMAVQEKFKAQGMNPISGTPEQFSALIQSESARYAKVIREAAVKVD